MEKIDFVILWVDDTDPDWLSLKSKYDDNKTGYYGSSDIRYRDWNNLKYLFRGIEKNAPWVNKIYFITWGHLPKWLNTNHPKLQIVNHKDYIPEKYLPTFNSNTIELNLHRIPDLSEHFVLLNDDTFIIKKTEVSDFFRDGKPSDQFVLNAILPSPENPVIPHTNVNNTRIINKYFNKNKVIKENFTKVFTPRYGLKSIRTLLLSPWNKFVGFANPHLLQAHLKSTFELLWEKEYEELDATCLNKFRKYNDVNHWLMRYWNMCSGNFVPRNNQYGQYFNIPEKEKEALNYIKKQKGKMICINDTTKEFDFEQTKEEFITVFESLLPEKSEFEK